MSIAPLRGRRPDRRLMRWQSGNGGLRAATSPPVRGDDDRMRPVDGEPIGRVLSGELVTETLDYDGGREVTVYVPPKPPQAVVFAGDGGLISRWGDTLEAADVAPTMIVGVHRVTDETLRLHEYSPRFDPAPVRSTREVLRRRRPSVDEVAVRGRAARRAHGSVRGLGRRGACTRTRASASGQVRRCLLRVAGCGLPATHTVAEFTPARVSRRRHARAVLPRQRGPVGICLARCRCRCRHA